MEEVAFSASMSWLVRPAFGFGFEFEVLASGFWVPRLSGFEFGFGLGLEVRVVARLS